MRYPLEKLSVITMLQMREIRGGEKFCDCAVEVKEIIISKMLQSEAVCEDWCCDVKHTVFDNLRGRFYLWDIEANADEIKKLWKKC